MNSTVYYFECSSGISGDMTVGALLDLGLDETLLREKLASLGIDGYTIDIHDEVKTGIRAKAFRVRLDHAHEHDHHHHEHDHHHHEHEHHHDHDHELGHHVHRNLNDIQAIIQNSQLDPAEQSLAIRMFRTLGEAEAYVHGTTIDQIHFHEVGAIDSIVDICATAIGFVQLGIHQIAVRQVNDGHGFVSCAHGQMPIPVPAVLRLFETHDIPMHMMDISSELVTPTGACILAAMCPLTSIPNAYMIETVGIGCGEKEFDHPNVLRIMKLKCLNK